MGCLLIDDAVPSDPRRTFPLVHAIQSVPAELAVGEQQPDDVSQKLEFPPYSLTAACALAVPLGRKLLSLTRDFRGPAASMSLRLCFREVGEPECVSRRGPAGLVQHARGSWVPAVAEGCAGELSACSRRRAGSPPGSTVQLEKVHQLAR